MVSYASPRPPRPKQPQVLPASRFKTLPMPPQPTGVSVRRPMPVGGGGAGGGVGSDAESMAKLKGGAVPMPSTRSIGIPTGDAMSGRLSAIGGPQAPAPVNKPAWQVLQERGIGGQGSAAANKALAATGRLNEIGGPNPQAAGDIQSAISNLKGQLGMPADAAVNPMVNFGPGGGGGAPMAGGAAGGAAGGLGISAIQRFGPGAGTSPGMGHQLPTPYGGQVGQGPGGGGGGQGFIPPMERGADATQMAGFGAGASNPYAQLLRYRMGGGVAY